MKKHSAIVWGKKKKSYLEIGGHANLNPEQRQPCCQQANPNTKKKKKRKNTQKQKGIKKTTEESVGTVRLAS